MMSRKSNLALMISLEVPLNIGVHVMPEESFLDVCSDWKVTLVSEFIVCELHLLDSLVVAVDDYLVLPFCVASIE